MKKAVFIGILLVVLGFSPLAKAALVNNGNGLIYDTDLNITWYDAAPVYRDWAQATSWAATLTVGNTAAGTWRLPSTIDGPLVWGFNGTTTYGYNITTSEMGHLFYTELSNRGYLDMNGNLQSGWGLVNIGPFANLQAAYYSSGTEYSLDPNIAWEFSFGYGTQSYFYKVNGNFALAVHEGNVGAPVPIPGAILLFAPGLAGLAVLRRRFKK